MTDMSEKPGNVDTSAGHVDGSDDHPPRPNCRKCGKVEPLEVCRLCWKAQRTKLDRVAWDRMVKYIDLQQENSSLKRRIQELEGKTG